VPILANSPTIAASLLLAVEDATGWVASFGQVLILLV
jgi:hypothetical protein